MNKEFWRFGLPVLAALALLVSVISGNGALAQGQPFAHPAFERVWTRTDKLVAQGQVGRSWFWGPGPRQATQEQWIDNTGGQRLVQYFDKSRMEINDPNGDQNSPFFVT